MDTNAAENLTTVAGWTTPMPAPTLLRYLHPIPRPYGYWAQLQVDARNYKPWLYWIGGVGLIAFGISWLWTHYPGRESRWPGPFIALASIVIGAKILLTWFRAISSVVQWARTEPLNVGVIRAVTTHPYWRDLAFADAEQADGQRVNVVIQAMRFVEGLLDVYGECEVLFQRRPWSWEKAESGIAIAARVVQTGRDKHATEPVLHWTGLNATGRLELEQIAAKTGYSIDAVFFVVSARNAAAKAAPDAGPEARPVDGRAGDRHVSARELCQYIPRHVVCMFGNPQRAAAVLSAWGLQRAEDVGAIVAGCIEAGWLKAGPGESADDFSAIDLPADTSRIFPGWKRTLWGRRPPDRGPTARPRSTAKAASPTRRALSELMRGVGVGLAGGVMLAVGFVLWAERLNPEERKLEGRWYAAVGNNGETLAILEFTPDRSFQAKFLHRGDIAVPVERGFRDWWVVRGGRLAITRPVTDYLDRLKRAISLNSDEVPEGFSVRTPDANTLETDFIGRQMVYRRVPADIASDADLFPLRPPGRGNAGPRQ